MNSIRARVDRAFTHVGIGRARMDLREKFLECSPPAFALPGTSSSHPEKLRSEQNVGVNSRSIRTPGLPFGPNRKWRGERKPSYPTTAPRQLRAALSRLLGSQAKHRKLTLHMLRLRPRSSPQRPAPSGGSDSNPGSKMRVGT